MISMAFCSEPAPTDRAISCSRSVTFDMAEATRTGARWIWSAAMVRDLSIISAFWTDVPPNFRTIIPGATSARSGAHFFPARSRRAFVSGAQQARPRYSVPSSYHIRRTMSIISMQAVHKVPGALIISPCPA